jgi:hypothetical protein
LALLCQDDVIQIVSIHRAQGIPYLASFRNLLLVSAFGLHSLRLRPETNTDTVSMAAFPLFTPQKVVLSQQLRGEANFPRLWNRIIQAIA